MNWLEQICNFFNPPSKPRIIGEVMVEGKVELMGTVAPEPELTEMQKIIAKFDPRKDMIVISHDKYMSLDEGEKVWLTNLNDRVFYFNHSSLVNIAIVRTY